MLNPGEIVYTQFKSGDWYIDEIVSVRDSTVVINNLDNSYGESQRTTEEPLAHFDINNSQLITFTRLTSTIDQFRQDYPEYFI